MAADICPCCKRKMPAPRVSDALQKKLLQDTKRALASIAQCETWLSQHPKPTDGFHAWAVSPSLIEAVQSHREHMQRAAMKPDMLWRIYRRADKGESYVGKFEVSLSEAA